MELSKKGSITNINLPFELKGRYGIFAAPLNEISSNKSTSNYVLCLQDESINVNDLMKIENIHLEVIVEGANTTYGMIIYILFVFWDIRRENDKFTYEVLLNPNDIRSYMQYIMLDKEEKWDVIVLEGNHILGTFTFANIYNIGEAIERAISSSKVNPCFDFIKAKNEYFRDFDIDELIN